MAGLEVMHLFVSRRYRNLCGVPQKAAANTWTCACHVVSRSPPLLCRFKSRIEGDGRDTVVLVRDPLSFQDKDIDNLRGDAEAEGIKMACPPEEVCYSQVLIVFGRGARDQVGHFLRGAGIIILSST